MECFALGYGILQHQQQKENQTTTIHSNKVYFKQNKYIKKINL